MNLKWIGGFTVVAGAVLATFLAAANAQSGFAIYAKSYPPGVLSAGQRTAAGNWAQTVWPSLTPASLRSIECVHKPTEGGTVDFVGEWACVACEAYTPTDAELLDYDLAGKEPPNGTRCFEGKPAPAQISSLESWARTFASLGGSAIVASVFVALTPGTTSHVTATVSEIVTASPSTYIADKRAGRVARLWGKVQ